MHRTQGTHSLQGIAREFGNVAHVVTALASTGHIGTHRDDLGITGIAHNTHVVGSHHPGVTLCREMGIKEGVGAA